MQQRTVRLIRKHTHAGRELAPGAQLVLEQRKAEWLVDQGAAVPVGWSFTRAALLTPPATARGTDSTKASAQRAAPTGCRGCGSAR